MAAQTPINTNGQSNQGIETKKTSSLKRFFRRFLLFLFLTLILIGTGLYFYFNFTYSEGFRAGTLIKFSHKGYVKTYEGELNLGGINPMPGNTIANNMWKFSVSNDSIATELMGKEGKILRLHYKEKIRSFFWQGETNYFVDGVEEVK